MNTIQFIFILTTGRAGSRLLTKSFLDSGYKIIYDETKDDKGIFYESNTFYRLNRFIDYERDTKEFDYSILNNYEAEVKSLKEGLLKFKKEQLNSGHNFLIIKDPRLIYLKPIYDEVFSTAKYIHLVRHPYDYALSENEEKLFYGKTPRKLTDLVMVWENQMKLLEQYRNTENLIEIRFEDLIINSAVELNRITKFIAGDRDLKLNGAIESKCYKYKNLKLNLKLVTNYMKLFNYNNE